MNIPLTGWDVYDLKGVRLGEALCAVSEVSWHFFVCYVDGGVFCSVHVDQVRLVRPDQADTTMLSDVPVDLEGDN